MNVSIITPAYNAAETIEQTIESVLAQTNKNWEMIIIDDGSIDSTAEIVSSFLKYDKRLKLKSQENRGEAAARNAGIAAARNEWLIFLDSDDWISPMYIERMEHAITNRAYLDAVHCLSERVSIDETSVKESFVPPEGDLFSVFATRPAFPIHACIVRKSIVEAAGRFDISFLRFADWDLWQRIARIGAFFGHVSEVLAFYRMKPGGVSLDAYRMLEAGLRIIMIGHSCDSRLTTSHHNYLLKLSGTEILWAELYLTCWYASILLGTGNDARPLLIFLEHDQYPHLHPVGVAQCIFEGVPIGNCSSLALWAEIPPNIAKNVEEFLIALEEKFNVRDLACRTIDRLRLLITNIDSSSER